MGQRMKKLIRQSLSDFEIIGFIPEQTEIVNADRAGRRAFENIDDAPKELFDVVGKLSAMKN